MTSAQKIIKKYKISIYKLVKSMGYNPQLFQGVWSRRLRGKSQIDEDQLSLLENTLKKIVKNEVKIDYEPLYFRIK